MVALALGYGRDLRREVGGEPPAAGLNGVGGDPVLRACLVHGLAGVGAHGRGLAAQRAGKVLPAVEMLAVPPDEQCT